MSSAASLHADDRLSVDFLGRVEGGDSVVEVRDLADMRWPTSLPYPPGDLAQLGAVGDDNEVDRQAVGRPHLRRAGDGDEFSSTSHQPGRSSGDVAAEYVEDEVDSADVFQRVVVEVDELVRAEVECALVVSASRCR